MSGAHDALRVHIHKQAEKESRDCGFEPEALAVVFADSWKRLRDTPGTKLRRLSSTPGYDFRLRIGGHRAVASVANDASGRLSAYVHEVGPRREVYERETFGSRLKAFWGSGSGRSKQPSQGCVAEDYRYLDPTQATPEKVPRASLHFLLQLQQQEFFDRVLPLLAYERSNEAELVIGHGPPGSGKTLVACDLALEAFLDGHDVDVLVPSVGLEHEYERVLKSWDALAGTGEGEREGVRIWRYPAFFAHIASVRLPFDRESRVRAWWHEVLGEPAFRASLGPKVHATGGISDSDLTERMPVLIDALLEDDEFWKAGAVATRRTKDRLAAVFEGFRAILDACRDPLLERLDSAQHSDGNAIVTRAGVATLPIVERLWQSVEHGGTVRPRLLIVDEAQDLAPAEWRRLLDLWFAHDTSPDAIRGRLVLLGDLDQRVSLVPFHWDDVKAYAISQKSVTPVRIEERQVDAASYRMRRNVATFASAVFDKRVVDQAKVRRHGRIDYEKLLQGGSVNVALVDRRKVDVSTVLAAGAEQRVSGEYFFVIHGSNENVTQVPTRNDLFLYSVRSAKGLEADRVIVVHPFDHRASHRPKPITPDEATEYYTAVSRAREHVLLVIDEACGSLLAPAEDAWGIANFHHIGDERSKLRSLVEECRIALTDDEVRNELVRQLNQITTQPGDFGELAGSRIEAILARLADSPDDDLSLALVQAGEQLASTDVSLFVRVRDGARRELAASRHGTAAATLLFTGEVDLARRVISTMPSEAADKWNPDWLGMVAGESCWQAWRGRSDAFDKAFTWTPELLERHVYGGAIRRIRGIVDTLTRSKRL
jgi:hypothetical protein